jgi:hypothetical protein
MRRLFFGVLLVVLFSFHVQAQEEPKCRSVVSGDLVYDGTSGSKVAVKKGTFCEYPADQKVAERLIILESDKKELKVKLDASEEKLVRSEKYSLEIDAIWEKKVKEQDEKIAYLSGFWRTYGKPILWAVVAGGAAATTTYVVMKLK